jgi:lipoprotein-releasing system ATP-binding protein
MSDAVLFEARGLGKSFRQGEETLNILHDIDLRISSGEIVALVGSSGAGKSTLLQMAGLLDRPSAGAISIGGQDVSNLNDRRRTRLRRQYLGFVYQFHYLQPEFSALENIVIPQMIDGVAKSNAETKGRRLLDEMGLSHRYDHRPARLSGGEQQRVAIARALANDPQLLLADEPTGNLDPATSDEVFSLLIRRTRDAGIGALIATHNMDLARRMDRVVEIKGGRLKSI